MVHLSDFILGLNPFLVVFTPASYFSPSPLICCFCVEPRFYTGFGFPPFPIFFLRLVLCIILCVNLLFNMYFVYTSDSPGTFWYLSGSTGTDGTSLVHRVQTVPLWFSLYSWYLPSYLYFLYTPGLSGTSKVVLGVWLSIHKFSSLFYIEKFTLSMEVHPLVIGWPNLS